MHMHLLFGILIVFGPLRMRMSRRTASRSLAAGKGLGTCIKTVNKIPNHTESSVTHLRISYSTSCCWDEGRDGEGDLWSLKFLKRSGATSCHKCCNFFMS